MFVSGANSGHNSTQRGSNDERIKPFSLAAYVKKIDPRVKVALTILAVALIITITGAILWGTGARIHNRILLINGEIIFYAAGAVTMGTIIALIKLYNDKK